METTKHEIALLVVLTLSLSLQAPLEVIAQVPVEMPEASGPVALSALQDTLEFVRRSKNYRLMGLTSKAEANQAALGRPMRIREIGYEKLVAHGESDDSGDVYTGPEQLLYPVTVGNEVRSSMILVRDGDDWRMTGYGDPGRTLEIEKTRMGLAQKLGRVDSGTTVYSIVSVPAFHLYFVAYHQDGKVLLTPVTASVPPGLKLDHEMEEAELVARLSVYAKAFDAEYGEEIRKKKLVN